MFCSDDSTRRVYVPSETWSAPTVSHFTSSRNTTDPSSVFTLLLKMTLGSICDCRRLEFSNLWMFGLDVETLSAACKLEHGPPSVSQSSGHHHPLIHPSRPAHLRLLCVFPVTEVQAPRWGLVPPGPELPPAHGGGGRSGAGPGSREEPVPDPECARIRHPRSHLTHEGRRESRLRFLSVLRVCWFVCRLCSQRLYWHPCSSSSDSLTVTCFLLISTWNTWWEGLVVDIDWRSQ